jgi:mRNA interferase MazF
MVIETNYVPRKGDLVWLNFSPQSGHEQAGRRPALCISPETYNSKVGLALFCPITSAIKNYPFESLLPDDLTVKGAILADQVKSMDWRSRQAQFIASLSPSQLADVLAKIHTLI